MTTNDFWNRPCAAKGLLSYRYRTGYAWIMIGARNDADALNEAKRSLGAQPNPERLQRWDGQQYV